MKVLILGANTGNGHRAVMRAIYDNFCKKNISVEMFPDFYENLYESNQILSDFYNMAQARSMELGVLLNEIMITEGQNRREKLYNLFKKNLNDFFENNPCDIVISVSSLINYHIIRFIKENTHSKKLRFYIVVTDPYKPLYPGFDIVGATAYFCPTEISKMQLEEAGIDKDIIHVLGYPIDSNYFYKNDTSPDYVKNKYGITKDRVVMINCGVSGSMSFLNLVNRLVNENPDIYFLILCGRNNTLYRIIANTFKSVQNNYKVFDFTENMKELYIISDLCITKPGANTIFESIITNTLPIIYNFEGLMYQERGIFEFLKEIIGIDLKFSDMDSLCKYISNDLNDVEFKRLRKNLEMYTQLDAAREIVEHILKRI